MKRVYAVLDTKADELGPLMTFRHEAAAIRAFTDLASNPQTSVHAHPEDYALLCLGNVREEHNEKLQHEAHTIDGFIRPAIVMTGAAWKAATEKPSNEEMKNDAK